MLDGDMVVGTNPRMRAIARYVRQIAPGLGTVLLTGESGTGKEVIARAIHHASTRRARPFVAVSCALFSDTLIESELFGYERGAFTGAVASRAGRFERAEGGTLFLDDIDDVPLGMQVKLLRALQNREIERLGATRAVPVDVRVLAGTKRDLRQLVAEGRFREDLFYRLNVLPIDLPPLRDRRSDIPEYIAHFLARFCARRGIAVPTISDAVMQALVRYDWPGNVRELENLCERIAEGSTCGRVGLGCLGASVLFESMEAAVGPEAIDRDATGAPAAEGSTLEDVLRGVETRLIGEALARSGGNRSEAARRLGVRRSTLGDRIARCGLDRTGSSVPSP
jgi:DNA-binding NtrC family response regulator